MVRESVAGLMLRMIERAGVRHLFGVPGDAINHIVDATRELPGLRFIQVRHEEAGAFAAAAQAKLSGNLAACMGTAGPGAIHLLNGLYDAKMDFAPVLAVTGQVATAKMGQDSHQEVNLNRLFADVAVYSAVIETPEQAKPMMKEAITQALARRGVAHVAVSDDIAAMHVETADDAFIMRAEVRLIPSERTLQEAAGLLDGAGKVAILAGIGCRDAVPQLIALAERLRAPVMLALRGKELLPDDHPSHIGGLGLLGGRAAIDAIDECDVLLMAGTNFPYSEFLPSAKPVIQIDHCAERLGRRVPLAVGLLGDTAETLGELARRVSAKHENGFLERLQRRQQQWRALLDTKAQWFDGQPVAPQQLAHLTGALAPEDAIFSVDTGEVTVWAARHLRLRGTQRFTLSGNLASMAVAMPAGIGAALAYPGRKVVALCGDGGFAMLAADFVTAVRYGLDLVCIVFDNGRLGFIEDEQREEGIPRRATELAPIDFAALAEACGGKGFRVGDGAQLESVLRSAFDCGRACVVHVEVAQDTTPLPPRVSLGQALGYSVARIKELLG